MPMATLAVDAGAPLAQASSSSGRRVSFAPPRAAPTRTPRHSATHTEAVGGRELASANGLTRVRWATCNIVGQRDEDCVSLHGANRGDKGALACFGVFDGHGGMDAARYASQRLLARVADESANTGESPSDELLVRAFAITDEEVCAQPGHCSGTTAVCVFVAAPTPGGSAHITCASVGDSAALALVPTGVRPDSLVGPKFRCLSWARTPGAAAHPQQPHQLVHLASSSAHSAENRSERQRIKRTAKAELARMGAALAAEAGGEPPAVAPESVSFAQRGSRLCLYVRWSDGSSPSLQMTRTIGDKDMTRVVTPMPSIKRIGVESGCSVRLVLATDGVWDNLPFARVSAILKKKAPLGAGSDDAPLAVARALALEARRSAEEGDKADMLTIPRGLSRKVDDLACIVVDVDVSPSSRKVEPQWGDELAIGGPSTPDGQLSDSTVELSLGDDEFAVGGGGPSTPDSRLPDESSKTPISILLTTEVTSRPAIEFNMNWGRLKDLAYCASGVSSDVWFATLDGVPVVVKVLKKKYVGGRVEKRLKNEVAILTHLEHPRVVRMLGAGHSPRFFLVLERLDMTLHDALRGKRPTAGESRRAFATPWPELLTLAIDLCETVEWLHHGRPGVILMHRDIKPQNVGFLNGELKLLDFDIAKDIALDTPSESTTGGDMNHTGCCGTLRYMAPENAVAPGRSKTATPIVGSGAAAAGSGDGQTISECLMPTSAKEQPYDETADTHSCAVLIWEAATGRQPFEGYDELMYMQNVVKRNVRPKLPEWWPLEFREVIRSCWDPTPSKRMRLNEAAARFRQMLQAFTDGKAAEPAPPPAQCCAIS